MPTLTIRNVPAKTAFLIDMSTWKMRSMGKTPSIIDYPGGEQYNIPYNEDAIQLRIGGYWNLTCSAPPRNAMVALGQ